MSDATRPRALLLTRNFPPLVGGMERLNQQVFMALAEDSDVTLIGPEGCGAHAKGAARVVEVPPRPLVRFLSGAMVAAWRIARRVRPQLVIAGSGLTAPHAWLTARCVGARSAVYVHGLDLVAPSWLYQTLWLRAIRAADVVVANSRHTAALAVAKGLRKDRIRVVNPGTVIPPDQRADIHELRKRLGFGSGPLLLSVGRLTERKGLSPFVRDVLPALVERFPGVELLVVGQDAIDALHGRGGSERTRIEAAAAAAGVASRLRFLGGLDDLSLEEVYRCADLHVFPVCDLPGDVEGFGMVALEAAARGVATVGYAVGGVPDAVSQDVSGELVPAGDAAALTRAIVRWLAMPREIVASRCRAFAEDFSWPAFGRRLRAALA